MTAVAAEDDWVHHAMKDDVAVVGVLLDIRHAQPPPSLLKSPALKLEWSVRQRRSKHVPRNPSEVDVVDVKDDKKMNKRKKAELTRASPTTPLSWSGGATSVSGGGASEESPMPTADAARSKVAVTSCTTISKRPRKRKTLAQLREEESLLLKERRNLKKELLTLRLNVDKQRATNESLKKIKLEQTMMKLASSPALGEAIWYRPAQLNAVSELTRMSDLGTSQSSCSPNIPYTVHEVGNCREAAFPLPDLNLPFEEDHNSEALCGLS